MNYHNVSSDWLDCDRAPINFDAAAVFAIVGYGEELFASSCDNATSQTSVTMSLHVSQSGGANCSVGECLQVSEEFPSRNCSVLSWVARANTTYYLVVSAESRGDASLPVYLDLDTVAPSYYPTGTGCRDAIELRLAEPRRSYLASSTPASGFTCSLGSSTKPGRWFVFRAEFPGSFYIHSCNSESPYSFTHEMYVYYPRQGDTVVCTPPNMCSYSGATSNSCVSVFISAQRRGDVFYAFFEARDSGNLSSFPREFSLTVNQPAPRSVVVPVPRAPTRSPPIDESGVRLDLCGAGQLITADSAIDATFDEAATTAAAQLGRYESLCGFRNSSIGRWFYFTPAESGTHYVSTCFTETKVSHGIAVFTAASDCHESYCVPAPSYETTTPCTDSTTGQSFSFHVYSDVETVRLFVFQVGAEGETRLPGNFRLKVSRQSPSRALRDQIRLGLGLGLGLPAALCFVGGFLFCCCKLRGVATSKEEPNNGEGFVDPTRETREAAAEDISADYAEFSTQAWVHPKKHVEMSSV